MSIIFESVDNITPVLSHGCLSPRVLRRDLPCHSQMSMARCLFDGRPADEALFPILRIGILREAQLGIRRRRVRASTI